MKGANPLGDGALYLWSQKLSLNTPVARFSGEQKVEFKIIGGESCRVAGLQGCRITGLLGCSAGDRMHEHTVDGLTVCDHTNTHNNRW